MVFSSLPFLYALFPVVLVAYFLIPNRVWRNSVLLVSSVFFYAWGEPKFVLLMMAATLVAWVGGLFIHRFDSRGAGRAKRAALILTVCLLVANLVIFKYLNFVVDNLNLLFSGRLSIPAIALPIGISFYTFQILSYVIDLYRGEVAVQRNFFWLALYVCFFPQLIAGPIVRYQTIEHEIRIHNTTFEAIIDNLKAALDIVENCGETYRYADDATKRLMNQAIFKRFLVSNDLENGLKVDAELASPFAQLQEPIKDDLIRINHASPERAKTLLDTIKAHLQAYFGDGLYDDVLSANSSSKGKNLVDTSKLEKSDKNTISSADCQDARQSEDKKKSASNFSDADLPYKSTFIKTHSNPSNFFGSNISSKGVLVDLRGIEPLSESLFPVLLLS